MANNELSGPIVLNALLDYIKRKYPISLGGGKVATKINFLEVLNLNDMNQNIRVSDGDIIVVPKSDEIVISQLNSIDDNGSFNKKILVELYQNL